MKIEQFSSVVSLIEEVGLKIVSWRTDADLRYLHSEVDFKTEADRQAHKLIFDGLSNLFPGCDIISEEGYMSNGIRPDRYWLIDPIDGTASWFHGFDGFVTQAAYIVEGVPIFGVIRAPVKEKTWMALRGSGAYVNNKPMPILESGRRLIMTDNTRDPHGITKNLMTLLHATGYLESGSLGLKSVLVADGSADLFVKDVCVRDWDIAPAAVILNEVGACLALTDGSKYVFNDSLEKSDGFIVARDAYLMQSAVSAFVHIKNEGIIS